MVQRKFDAIHEFHGSFGIAPNSSTVRYGTIIPLIMNDDALGDPMSFNANPEHASWSEQARPNCYPDSEVRSLRFSCDVFMPGPTANTLPYADFEYALISCAFPEDLDAIDEKSGLSLKEVVELQHESTDRQCYPLWNAVDMLDGSTMHSDVPGLTTTQVIEAVAWDSEIVRDQRRYGKIKGLLRKTLPIGIRKGRVNSRANKGGGHTRFTINFIPSNAKFINPYTFLGCMIRLKQVSALATLDATVHQLLDIADVANDVEDIQFAWHCQFNERNPEFHMAKV